MIVRRYGCAWRPSLGSRATGPGCVRTTTELPAMTRPAHTQLEHPTKPSRPVVDDQEKDKRFVLWSLSALIAIFGFFFAVDRIDFKSRTAGDTSRPQAETTAQSVSAGSSSLPKGPASQ